MQYKRRSAREAEDCPDGNVHARLQGSGSKNPILMRVSYDSGHGIGTALSERDQQRADVLMFLFDQLGVKYRPVPPSEKSGKSVPSL